MGTLTRTQLLAAGQGKAGITSTALTTRLTVEFQAWLDRQYAGWSWPFLKNRATGLSLSAGATSLTIGGGYGGITPQIIRLVSPVLLYTSDRSVRAKAPIIQASGGNSLEWDETLQDSATWRGTPQVVKVKTGTSWGVWDVVPMPFPDRALLLAIDYFEMLSPLGASDIPSYPSDATMIDAICAMALVDQKGFDHPAAQAATAEVQAKVARDRSTYGHVPGENDILQLDSSVFR